MKLSDDDVHDELMDAIRAYYKAHHEWVNKGTRQAGKRTRWWLSEIRRIAKAQRKVIMDWRYDIDEKKRIKKAQKQQAQGKNDDN